MKKLTWALLSLMLFLGLGAAFADEGDTPAAKDTIILSPASGATVIDGSSVTITFDNGFTGDNLVYLLAETKEAAEAANMMDAIDYTEDNKPVITADKPVLRVQGRITYYEDYNGQQRPRQKNVTVYGEYTIATGDIANPVFVVEGNPVTSYDVTFNAMFSIQRGEGDNDSELWYTTDGSTPAKDGDKSTKFTEAFEIGSVLGDDEEGEVTIKAIAVAADGKTSAVVMATFTVKPGEPAKFVFTDPMGGVVPEGYYGKYVGLMPMVIKNEWPMAYRMYYTVDGATEPSEEAFDDQDADADGPIYMISFDGEEMPSMMFTENATVFKAVIHAMKMDEETGQPDMSTAVELNVDETLMAMPVAEEVEFKVNEEGKLEITNADEFTMIYYTTDGTVPSFGNATNGKLYDEDDMIELEGGKTVKIVGFSAIGEGMGTSFTAGSDMIEITKPLAPTFEPVSATTVDFGAELTLSCATEDVMILYTLNGSEPSAENDNAHYYSEYRKPGITAKTIKAVAMLDGVYSDVVTATYTFNPITATLSLSPMKDDTVGMNVGTGIEFSIDGWEAYDGVAVYYTVDGTTEPSKAAYDAQADPNGTIKMLTVQTEEYEMDGETYTQVVKTDGHALAITFKEATHLKAIGYITVLGEEVTTPVLDEELKIKSETMPTFSLNGTKVSVGEKLVIENPNPYPEMPEMPEDYWDNEESAAAYEEAYAAYEEAVAAIPATIMYFSFDGTEPTGAAYDGQPDYEYDKWSVFKTQEGQNVTVFFRMDKDGYYLYVPEVVGYNSPADTIRLSGDAFTLKAMAVSTETEEGEGGDFPMPFAGWGPAGAAPFMYGSDVATAAYTVGLAKPEFSVASGEVSFGTEVEISCISEGVKIFYYCYIGDAEPKAVEYKEAIKITQSMKINAVAMMGEVKSELAEASYTIIAKPTFSVAAGEVEAGTKVTLACATEDAKIYYTVDGSEPTAESTEYTEAIEIAKAMTVKAIAIKGEAKSEMATAAYKIKTANEDLELAGVSVYPNPSNGLFNIELPVAATVEVFMSNGMLYQRMKLSEGNTALTIDRSGIYFLRITGEGRTAVKRVIVR